jgi:hypothetical protein
MILIKISILIFLTLFIFGCKENSTVKYIEPDSLHIWSPVSKISGVFKLVTTAKNFDDFIFFKGVYSTTTISKNNLILNSFTLNTIVNFIKEGIGNKYMAEISNGTVVISDIRKRDDGDYYYIVDFKNIDSNYISLNLNTSFDYEANAININDQLIVPILSKDPTQKPILYLLDIIEDNSKPFGQHINIKNLKRLQIDESTYYTNYYQLTVKGENFFYLNDYGTYKIDKNGNHKKVLKGESVRSIFQFQNKLFEASIPNGLFTSSDDGENWTEFDGYADFLVNSRYYTVSDSLIAVYHDQLFTVQITNDSYNARELVDKGLEGNIITSVNEFNDNIYISTLAGVFVKPKSTFFDSK